MAEYPERIWEGKSQYYSIQVCENDQIVTIIKNLFVTLEKGTVRHYASFFIHIQMA